MADMVCSFLAIACFAVCCGLFFLRCAARGSRIGFQILLSSAFSVFHSQTVYCVTPREQLRREDLF